MRIGILHISDIHFKADSQLDIPAEVRKISAAVVPRLGDFSALLVAISGDVSYSGTSHEYQIAAVFVQRLMQELASGQAAQILGPAIIPGNHDCDFSSTDKDRALTLKHLPRPLNITRVPSEKIRELTRVHDAFYEFERQFSNQVREVASRLYFSHVYPIFGQQLVVHCFNTAWVSMLKERQGGIVFPIDVQTVDLQERPLLSISIFHHPYEWFEPTNRRLFLKSVESISDIALTGHEHEGDAFVRKSKNGSNVSYIEGMAFSAEGARVGFNLIDAYLQEKKATIYEFVNNGSMYEPSDGETIDFLENPQVSAMYFENDPEFEKELLKCPVSFSSSLRDELKIDDIFVYPDLQVKGFIDRKSADVKGESVSKFVLEKRHVHIVGETMSGKTTFARKLYRDLKEHYDFVPILLSGKDLSGKPASAFRDAERRAFAKQYSRKLSERFIQLDKSRKALIIDDWHKTDLNQRGRSELLNSARNQYSIIVTLGTDPSWLHDLLEAAASNRDVHDSVGTNLTEFVHCELREFGFRLREQLLMKWHSLDQEYSIEDSELVRRVSRTSNLLNSVLGAGLFPSYPIFIIYTLQRMAVDPGDIRTHGAYGHVYEAFITRRLSPISKQPTDVGAYYTYLSQLAYGLFSQNKEGLTSEEIRAIHSTFVADYDIPWEFEPTISALSSAGIIAESEVGTNFTQKYCYYFFVAKFFQKALGNDPSDETMRQKLREMAEMVHDDEYMNILIFYVYLTNDRNIIEYFLDRSRKIFAESSPCELRADVTFLDELLQPRKIQLERTDVLKNRSEFAERRDHVNEKMETNRERSVRTRYNEALDQGLKIAFAIHSLQVMGQILKNFPGDLRADLKCSLTNESYQLGLRQISAFIELIKTNMHLLREPIEQMILSTRARRDDQSSAADAGRYLAYLVEGVIFGIIKKISASLGMEDLRLTFASVKKSAGEENLPVRLIDLAIQLDHYTKMPISDIEEFEKATQNRLVAHNILVMLVFDHLHLFEIDYKDRQRIGKILNVNTAQTLLTDKKIRS